MSDDTSLYVENARLRAEVASLRAEDKRLRRDVRTAMDYANGRWGEWGERAENVADMLEAALAPDAGKGGEK